MSVKKVTEGLNYEAEYNRLRENMAKQNEENTYLLEELKDHAGRNSMLVLRPADAAETTVAWQMAMENTDTPTALILSRQNINDVPSATGNRYEDAQGARKGGYVVVKDENPDVVLVGNGSEVSTLVAANELLKAKGVKAQIVSIPSLGLYFNQDRAYRESVIPSNKPVFGLTAGLPSTLYRVVGANGKVFGLDHFGESAPYKVLDEKFGFTADKVASEIEKYLSDYSK